MNLEDGCSPNTLYEPDEHVLIIEYAKGQYILITAEQGVIGIDVSTIGKFDRLKISNTFNDTPLFECKAMGSFFLRTSPKTFFLDTSHPKLKSLLNVNLSLTFEGKKESSFTLANVYLKNLLDI